MSVFLDTAQYNIWYKLQGNIQKVDAPQIIGAQQILIDEAYTILSIVPPTFAFQAGMVTEYDSLVVVPPQFVTLTEEIAIADAHIEWVQCPKSPKLWKKVFFPATYVTVSKQVVAVPAQVISNVRVVTDKILITPTAIIETLEPAIYTLLPNNTYSGIGTLQGTLNTGQVFPLGCRGRQ
ncbi:MAG: hypothetical protein JNM36_17825 [Chitinophagales bacterium]|nr:hypothetical protein [Chitinophagales bacterium]